MGNWLKGILILALLAIFATFVWPFNANKRSAEMGSTIQDALNANGFDFAKVDMNGNVARLSGTAPSEAAMSAATELAKNTKCKSCADKKTWHKVVNDLVQDQIATVSPYTFNAVMSEDDSVVLNGYVRNEAEEARVLREAESLFPGKVSNRTIEVSAGAPNAGWGDIISFNLSKLSQLESGQFSLNDNRLTFSGLAANEGVRADVASAVSSVADGYMGKADITVPSAPVVEVVNVEAEAQCQTLVNELKGNNKIEFETNKAGIKGENSFNLLNTLAAAAKDEACSSFRIKVVGHTDSDGSAEYNFGLSERRAASVVAYLVQEQRLDISRLSAEGMGETMPIADNATREGKAKNRRIEFIISQTQ